MILSIDMQTDMVWFKSKDKQMRHDLKVLDKQTRKELSVQIKPPDVPCLHY